MLELKPFTTLLKNRVRIFLFMPHTLQPELQSELETTKQTFEGLGINAILLDVLRRLNYFHPTPIQLKTIPAGIDGKDVLGIAQTGTGKTLAFGVPMIQRLTHSDKEMGLIMVPTRELALQVFETMAKIAGAQKLNCALLMGGESMHRQLQQLRANPRIIIATPGRLQDHINQRTCKLDRVSIMVLDEADRMLDMGFAPQIKEIVKTVPAQRQTLLFSATMPHELTTLAHSFMKDPQRIEVAPQGTAAANVTQELYYVQKFQKLPLLVTLVNKYKGSILVFSRTKHGAKHITTVLRNNKINAAEIHSNKTLKQRVMALEGFKKGIYRVLVATDIAARGIHVNNIEVVINYDLPQQSSDYVHRIGRTGRAGLSGHAISFATADQRRDVKDIERLLKKALKVSTLPELPKLEFVPMSMVDDSRKPYGSRAPRREFKSGTGYKPHKQFADTLKERTGGYGNSDKKVYGSAGSNSGSTSTHGSYAPRAASNSYAGSKPRPYSSSAPRPYSSSAPKPYASTSTPGTSAPRNSESRTYAAGSKRTFGAVKPWAPKREGGEYRDRSKGFERRPYAGGAFKRDNTDTKSYGEKREGAPFAENPKNIKKSYSSKPFASSHGERHTFSGAKRSFGDKPSFGKKPFGKKPFGKKPFGKKPFGRATEGGSSAPKKTFNGGVFKKKATFVR